MLLFYMQIRGNLREGREMQVLRKGGYVDAVRKTTRYAGG